MSRNLGRTDCAFCHGKVVIDKNAKPRPITREDCGVYFPEYEGMIVAEMSCVDCEAPYLAWLDGTQRTSRHKGWGWNYPDRPFENEPQDLSHRYAFNDEPSQADFPKWEMVRVRKPWPRCDVCARPCYAFGGCSQEYKHVNRELRSAQAQGDQEKDRG